MLHLACHSEEIVASSDRIPLLVVGGGIGGLAAALAASQAGLPVHVIEKSEEFAEIGAGLQLAPNAMRALDQLGIYKAIYRHAHFPRRLLLRDALTDKPVAKLDVGEKFRAHFGYPYIVIHRGDLLNTELEACRASTLVTLESKKEAAHIENLGNGARVVCTDGTTYECDSLLGADGLWSKVRKMVHDDGEPICAQCVCYRGAIPIEEAPADSDFDNMTIWMGPDIHFVQYVVHHGTVFNQVAVFKSNRYKEGSLDWGTPDELDEHFSQTCPRVRHAVATTIKRDRCWPMFDRRPIDNWTRDRITLLGDAAHPMFQYLAQGACQALEDAACLMIKLRESCGDVARAFFAYQQTRIPRTARVQNSARFAGDLFHVEGIGRIFRNELLAKRTDDDVEHLEWLYGNKGCE
jgi:3-hydroxybenzoate 6-monooxygenase